jgi:hypothetical protein
MFDINDPIISELSRVPKTRNMVAREYNVSVRTLNRWLHEKKLEIPQDLICPGDLRMIYSTLAPPDLKKEDKK